MATPKDNSKAKKRQPAGHARDDWNEDDPHECSPWVETPSSSRVRRFRFDFATSNVHVVWANSRGAVGHVYENVPSEIYRAFTRSSSPGGAVNSMLNGFHHRPITPEELNLPSSTRRPA